MQDTEKLPTAVPLAMILCQSIARVVGSNSFVLYGLFSVIESREAPIGMDFHVYASLTAVRQRLNIRCAVFDVDDNLIAEAPVVILHKPADPTIELAMTAKFSVEFPSLGHYFVKLRANGEYIIERRLSIVEPHAPPESESLT